MTTAVVRVWHADDGWGVVDAEDVPGGWWVHFSVVDMPGYRELRAGQQVLIEFERLEQDGYVYRASRAQPLDEAHLAPRLPGRQVQARRFALVSCGGTMRAWTG